MQSRFGEIVGLHHLSCPIRHQWIQSLRAIGVMFDHNARAFGAAAARAFLKSDGPRAPVPLPPARCPDTTIGAADSACGDNVARLCARS